MAQRQMRQCTCDPPSDRCRYPLPAKARAACLRLKGFTLCPNFIKLSLRFENMLAINLKLFNSRTYQEPYSSGAVSQIDGRPELAFSQPREPHIVIGHLQDVSMSLLGLPQTA